MLSKTRFLRVMLLIVLVAAALSGMGASRAQDVVKVAIMGPFTGGAASVGQEQLNFARLAVENFKKTSGMSNVELVEVDTQLDPAQAVTGANLIIADASIVAVVGPAGSQEVEAVSPIFEPEGIAYVSPSATRPSLTLDGKLKNFFRVVPRDDVQGPTAATFMVEQLEAKKVYLIDDQTSYSTGLADEVQKKLTELNIPFDRDSITQRDTDFSALVTKIKGAAPDVVFMSFQLASQAAQIATQMKEQGVTAIVFGGDGVFSPEDFIKNAGGATEGAYVSFFAPDLRGVPEAAEVVAAYEAQFGDFGSFGGPAYVATNVALEAVARAMKAGAVTRAAVREEIAKTKQKSSILGIPISFDDKGDIVGAAFFIFQVRDGKFALITTSEEAMMEATPEATPGN